MRFTETQRFFILGIANWCIFLNHIPSNVVSLLTLRNLGFSGPVDLLIFTVGYSAAVTYGRMVSEQGLVVAATRVLGRALRLYGAYLVLFVAYVAAIAFVARRSSAPEIIQEYHLLGIIDQPVPILQHAMLLQVTPSHLDVLKLLIVLLAAFPLVLWGLSWRPNLTLLDRLPSISLPINSAGTSRPFRTEPGDSIHSPGNSFWCSALGLRSPTRIRCRDFETRGCGSPQPLSL
jgi:OpgC protein